MPHVAFVAFAGLRVYDTQLAALGVTLPGLGDRARAVQRLPSLGLLTLAGMLPQDWSCSYHEADGNLEVLFETLVVERPTLVAMSALTPSVHEAYALAARLRAAGVRTALGGLHATSCPNEASQYVDSVAAGEGELVWRQMLADVHADRLQPHYAAVRTTRALPPSIPCFQLAATPSPARWTVQTQRGCPLACEFCAASRTISRFREKPVASLREELSAIARLSPRPVIELADDNTFVGSRDPAPLLDTLASVDARYFTEVDWRIGERPELLARLAASGCVQVLIGVESLVFRFPGMGAKEASLERVVEAIDRIQEAGVAVNGCFIVGGDGETRLSIDRMRAFIQSSRLADVQVTLSTPFPGTPLRTRLERSGRLLHDDDWRRYTLFDVTFQPDRLSVAELEHAYRDLLASVYDASEAQRRASLRRDIWRRNPRLRGESW